MVERQETQCAKRSAAFRGDLLTFLRVYDRPGLQADLLSAKDIDLSRISGPGCTESKLIGPAALSRLRIAGQQVFRICLRQRNSGSWPCTDKSDGTCLTEQVHQLFIIKRGVEKQRLASGRHQPPENDRPALTGLKSQTDPLIARAEAQTFNPAAAANCHFLQLTETIAAFLTVLQPICCRCPLIGTENVEKTLKTGTFIKQFTFLFI